MAAGTVGYTDTTGNRDYIGEIASQITRRVGEASDMASQERAFAEEQAEAGGTSLSEAGIGRGFFFGRALGSTFGGDRIARTRGRFARTPSAGTDPTATAASRFRGGFDYNVTNEISSAGVAPLTTAVASGLSGVESGLIAMSQSMIRIDNTLGGLERTQADTARALMGLGYMMAMLRSQSQRASGRASLAREERGIEGGGGIGGGSIGGASFGGAGGGRGMINITPGGGSAGGSGGLDRPRGGGPTGDGFGASDVISFATGRFGVTQAKNIVSAGRATKSLLRTGELGSGVARGTILKAAAQGGGGVFDAAKVSQSLTKFLGADATGIANPFMRLIKGSLYGGPNTAKAGAEALEGAFINREALEKMFPNANPKGLDMLEDMGNFEMKGVDSKFSNELTDIKIRSDKYKKFAHLHGNNKLRRTQGAVEYMDQLGVDRKTFKNMRQNGKRVFSDDAIEGFLKLGLSPGKENVDMFNAGAFGRGSPFNAEPTSVVEANRIAEDLDEFFPNGISKFKSPEDAVIATKFARELDSIKKGKKPTKKEAELAMKNMEAIFGQQKVHKAFIESSSAIMTNTNFSKAVKGLGKGGGRLMKLIPGISAIMGAYFAIDRARKGDFLGAGLEITSGLAGIVPGIGTKTGLAIDGYLLARDMGIMPLNTGTPHVGLEGTLRGKKGGTDTNLAMLSNGESVLNQKATASLGIGNIAALNLLGAGGLGAGLVMGMMRKKKDYTDLQGEGFVKGMNKLSGARSASLVNFDFSRNDSSQNMSQNIDQAFFTKLSDTLAGSGNQGAVVQNITNNNVTTAPSTAGDDSGASANGFSDASLDFVRVRFLSGLM